MFQLSEDDLLPFLLNDNKTIITTVTNSGYLFYTLNMLKSLKQYNLDKKIFIVSIDRKGVEILNRFGYDAYCIDDKTLGKFCPWNSKGYDKICYLKLELIYRALQILKGILVQA